MHNAVTVRVICNKYSRCGLWYVLLSSVQLIFLPEIGAGKMEKCNPIIKCMLMLSSTCKLASAQYKCPLLIGRLYKNSQENMPLRGVCRYK